MHENSQENPEPDLCPVLAGVAGIPSEFRVEQRTSPSLGQINLRFILIDAYCLRYIGYPTRTSTRTMSKFKFSSYCRGSVR